MQILHTLHINKHSIFSAGKHTWDSFPECSGQSQMLVLNSGTRDPFCRRETIYKWTPNLHLHWIMKIRTDSHKIQSLYRHARFSAILLDRELYINFSPACHWKISLNVCKDDRFRYRPWGYVSKYLNLYLHRRK